MIRRLFGRSRAAGEREAQTASLRRELAESQAQREILQQALHEVRQGIVVIAPNDEVLFMNPMSAKLIRPSATLQQLTPHALQVLIRSARSGSFSVKQEIEMGRPPQTLQATASAVKGGVVLILNDVTESRRIDAVRRDFVAHASHELKTPVSSILASAEAMQMALRRDPAAAQQFANQIETSARQLASLVADLLDLSRLESTPSSKEEVPLDEVVRAELADLSERAQQGGITLEAIVQPVMVRGSRSDLGLALRNLLDNALRHTPEGGQVTVSLSSGDATVDLEVTDTGEGIASRELPRIFERFYRADPARSRATGGTGLGLAIVRHVVESHGGSITATSVLGEGATFTIRLRALDASDPEQGAANFS